MSRLQICLSFSHETQADIEREEALPVCRRRENSGGKAEPPGIHTLEEDLERFRLLAARIADKRKIIDLLLEPRDTPYSGVLPDGVPEKEK